MDHSKSIDPRREPDETFELYSIPSHAEGHPEIVKGREIGSAKKTLVPGTVVVSKINPRINRVWVVGSHTEHAKIGSGEWIPFFPVDGIVPDYLAFYMRQNDFRDYLATRVSGVGGSLMRVKPSTLADYPLVLPSEEHQHRIVEAIESYLTRLDDAVASLERVQRNLERYRASVLKAAVEGHLVPTEAELARKEGRSYEPASELLKRILAERKARWIEDAVEKARAKGVTDEAALLQARKQAEKKYKEPEPPDTTDLPDLPEGWCWTSIGEAFDVLVGATPSRREPTYWGGDIAWVSSGEVAFNRIRSTRETITEVGLAETSTTLSPPGTVLIGMIGEGRTRGQVAIQAIHACNNQNSAAIRVADTPCVSEYVYHYLMSQYEQTRRRGTGGNQPALSKGRVSAIPLPLPPAAEQARIAEMLEQKLSVEQAVSLEICRLGSKARRLRQSILKWAFEGKLVEQDPDEEPAAILLNRIRSQTSGVKR